METTIRISLFLLALAISAGCSTTPTSSGNAVAAPVERLSALQDPPAGEYATLVVTRDQGFWGSACDTVVSVDGREVGRIRAGEMARFYVKPGVIILAAQATSLCPGGLKERQVKLDPASLVRYRISIDASGVMDLSPTAF